ncbi:MAG: DUF3644 domain-containing protein [Chloroflexi bacterium]|nr:DUF3644 domain-containing protein [Chloroflexota bacterium]MBP8056190.1 DUF3644 domain-containing protein [Chloroflexota bacterium]
MAYRRVWSIKQELVVKAREAAFSAIRAYNDPLITFKSETFIVLMIIAWTYMLHAYFRSEGIDYRYFRWQKSRRIFDRTKTGAFKYWELERCLNESTCPIDKDTANNLRFLIKLRHEIEHQMTLSLDGYLSGRYQACAINFNHYLKQLFGPSQGLDQHLTYSIQLAQITRDQFKTADTPISGRLKAFITEFDQSLSGDELNSSRFSIRLLFTKRTANRPGQADSVVEFLDPKSALAQSIDKEYWVLKPVEKPKFRAKDVVARVRSEGFTKFRISPEHTELWKAENAKDPSKGYGVDVQGTWYWYQNWIDYCIKSCTANPEKYEANEITK